MKNKTSVSRRNSLKNMGATGISAMAVTEISVAGEKTSVTKVIPKIPSNYREKIFEKVFGTTLIDTHEHILEEKSRFLGDKISSCSIR